MVSGLLQRSLPLVWVAGELSNLTRATSGHWYFTLKDRSAQVRAVMFRGRAQHVDFAPREGDQVELRALATLYEPRGDFQLNVEVMRRAGAGDLYQRFLQLKARLEQEGLFDPARKRVPPRLPLRIGVITSLQAAALRDVLTTLARRAPHIPVVVYPALVQGDQAPGALIAAIGEAARRAECDVLLLVRGGGAIEDLWAFNDETLARTMAASPIPIICGVGHETDFTIADFVADIRAPTPTAAAERVAPERRELIDEASSLARAIDRAFGVLMERSGQRLDLAVRWLRPPSAQWRERNHRLSLLITRMRAAQAALLARALRRATRSADRLRAPRLEREGQRLVSLSQRLIRAMTRRHERCAARVEELAGALALVSPKAVLDRGYAIVRAPDGRLVRDAGGLTPGDPLTVQLAADQIEVKFERSVLRS
jgi:exodeoxyribonuclease VII large subunit